MTITIDGDRDGLLALTTDPNEEVWCTLLDAVAGLAEATGTTLRVPGWAIPSMAWWWATAEVAANGPRLTERARARINAATQRADRLQIILDAPVTTWAWPVLVESPEGSVTFRDPVEFGFTRQLRDFQSVQVARLLGSGDGMNLSVPGAGKTAVAYACLGAWFSAGSVSRAVVIAPISAHEAWETEPGRCFAPGHEPSVAILPSRPASQVVVYNYEALQDGELRATLGDWLATAPSVVIFDEAHRAKAGRDGVRGLACLELASNAARRVVLTGTPAPNGPADLQAMFNLVWAGQGHALVNHPRRNHCFVRATKSILGLPPMTTTVERIPMSSAHERLYQAAVGVAAAMVNDPKTRADLAQIGRIAMLLLQAATNPAAVLDPDSPLRMTGERTGVDLDTLARAAAAEVIPAKFVRARQLIEANVADRKKTLIWTNFVHHIDDLTTLLADYEPAVIMGSVPRRDRDGGVDRTGELLRFRTDPSCQVLLATPQSLGEGVSLHETCTRQIHIDRTYNAGVFLQALDRIHRLGLAFDADPRTTIFVTEGTIDECVEIRLNSKVAAMSALLNDPDLLTLSLPDFDDTLSTTDLFLDGGNAQDLADLFAHLHI
jgi:hypothetical protein